MTTTASPDPLAEGLWTLEGRFTTMGLPISSRTTLVRLADGSLAVVNPGPLPAAAERAVAALGRPSVLICPNRFHHLFAADWKRAWPQARLWAAPGLAEKEPALPVDAVLGRDAPGPWAAELEPLPIDGMPRLAEWWFFHAATETLVVTDVLARVGPRQPWFLRLWAGLNGSRGGRLAVPHWLRAVLLKDRAAAGRSMAAALARGPRRLVVAHGDPLPDGAATALRAAPAGLAPADAGNL